MVELLHQGREPRLSIRPQLPMVSHARELRDREGLRLGGRPRPVRGGGRPGVTTDPAGEPTRASWKAELAVFLLSMAIVVIPTVQLLVQKDGNVTALLNVGEQAASRPFVEHDFADVALVKVYGHDGQQFYVVARSITDLQQIDGNVDRPRYRARRILLPAARVAVPGRRPDGVGHARHQPGVGGAGRGGRRATARPRGRSGVARPGRRRHPRPADQRAGLPRRRPRLLAGAVGRGAVAPHLAWAVALFALGRPGRARPPSSSPPPASWSAAGASRRPWSSRSPSTARGRWPWVGSSTTASRRSRPVRWPMPCASSRRRSSRGATWA